MKLGGIGVPELLIILAVALLIFGPKNLPKLGSALGKTVKNLRDGMAGKPKEDDIVEIEEASDGEAVVEEVEEAPAQASAKKASKKKSSKTAKAAAETA